MSDGIAGAIAISLFGSDHSILCLRFGLVFQETRRRGGTAWTQRVTRFSPTTTSAECSISIPTSIDKNLARFSKGALFWIRFVLNRNVSRETFDHWSYEKKYKKF
ncbi:hypothetical protein V1478_006955, partial [Vespula squamosa]